MKTITGYLLVSLCLCSTTLSAQNFQNTVSTFQNILGVSNNFDYGKCAVTDADGNLLVAGSISGANLVKFNPEGSVISRLTVPELHGTIAVGMEAIHNDDGKANGYIVVFNTISGTVVARFNNYGKALWGKNIYPTSPGRGKVVQAAYNPVTNKLNGFYLAALDGSIQLLMKLSIDGNILWQKQISYPTNSDAFFMRDILTEDDGGCMVTGELNLASNKPVLMKFSSSGKLLWGRRYDFYYSADGASITTIAATNNGYLFSGVEYKNYGSPNLTFKTNKAGDIVWANNYSIPYNAPASNKIITDANGNIIFAGPPFYGENDTAHNAYIAKLDSNGNIIFGKRYYYSAVLNAVVLTAGGYYAVGNTDVGSGSIGTDLYVIKTNTAGNIGGNCSAPTALQFTKKPTQDSVAKTPPYILTDRTYTATDLTLTTAPANSFPQNLCGTGQGLVSEIQEQPALNSIAVSPNPSHGVFTVTYNSTNTGKVQLNVYDKTGKLMFTKTEQAVKGNNTYQLNLSNLINGMYNLQLSNAAEHGEVNFVIEK